MFARAVIRSQRPRPLVAAVHSSTAARSAARPPGWHWQRWSDTTASLLRARAASLTSAAVANLARLGARLNHITGYEEINELKRQVVLKENQVNESRQAARRAKQAYDEAVTHRAKSQREVNDLLQRKSSWTDDDVSRFTLLVRQDHLCEQDEARAKASANACEDAVEKDFNELMRTILARYHEEQVWSDKIRSASTYGSLAVLAMNLFVFITAIIIVEPWKRKRLLEIFEQRVSDMNVRNQAVIEQGMQDLQDRLGEQAAILTRLDQKLTIDGADADEQIRRSHDEIPIQIPMRLVSDLWKEPESIAIVAGGAVGFGMLGWFLRTWYR